MEVIGSLRYQSICRSTLMYSDFRSVHVTVETCVSMPHSRVWFKSFISLSTNIPDPFINLNL